LQVLQIGIAIGVGFYIGYGAQPTTARQSKRFHREAAIVF